MWYIPLYTKLKKFLIKRNIDIIKMNLIFDIETTGLNPLIDRIICIALKSNGKELIIIDSNEKVILEKFWNYVREIKIKDLGFRLIGFNCWSFDLPFLIIRSFKHGVNVVDTSGKVIDLRYLLSYGNKYQNGKLSDYAELIGLEQKYNGYDGSDMKRLFEEDKFAEIEKYALSDIKITFGIYKRALEIGLIGGDLRWYTQ